MALDKSLWCDGKIVYICIDHSNGNKLREINEKYSQPLPTIELRRVSCLKIKIFLLIFFFESIFLKIDEINLRYCIPWTNDAFAHDRQRHLLETFVDYSLDAWWLQVHSYMKANSLKVIASNLFADYFCLDTSCDSPIGNRRRAI